MESVPPTSGTPLRSNADRNMTTAYGRSDGLVTDAAVPRSVSVRSGTVASRIRSFQGNINHNEHSHRVRSPNHNERLDSRAMLRVQADPIVLKSNISSAIPDGSGNDSEETANYTGPFPTPASTRPASSLGSVYIRQPAVSTEPTNQPFLYDNVDGPSQLAAVRSRLRSITEQSDTRPQGSESKDSVLSELDHLLQDAIDQQHGDDTRGTRPVILADKSAQEAVHTAFPSPRTQSFKSDINDIVGVRDSDAKTCQAPPIYDIISPSGSKAPSSSVRRSFSGKKLLRPGSHDAFPGLTSLESEILDKNALQATEELQRHETIQSPAGLSPHRLPPRLPFFPRYRSRSLDKPLSLNQLQGRQRQSRQSTNTLKKEERTVSRPSPSHAALADHVQDPHHLPLMLPRIAEGRGTDETADQKDESDRLQAPQSAVSQNGMKFSELPHLDRGGSSRTAKYATANETRHDASSDDDQGAQEPNLQRKKPSLIEHKIRNLLAAARKHDVEMKERARWTAKPNKVKEGVLKENIRYPHDIYSRTLPNFQIPINDQAKFFHDESTLDSPKKSHTIPDKTTPSPIRTTYSRSSPVIGTSSRPVSRQVRESLSPRASAYTFEQRFAISPSRSPSRMGPKAVRVSVELRPSPDRNDMDDQLLFVRASVEPDDTE